MDNNSNPLQSQASPGTLPQPTAFAQNTTTTEAPSNPLQPLGGGLDFGGQQAQVGQADQNTQSSQAIPPASNAAPVAQSAAPASIPDSDDISPQWVHTVEGLKRQFINDPRQYALEFEKAKAKYVSSRYGKQLKLPEENK